MSALAEVTDIRQLKPVKWAKIEKEVQPYREGFVQTFLKYQGALTDEVDGRGRVSVTIQSFARHFGIPARTFYDWVAAKTIPADTAETGSEATDSPAPRCRHCPIHCQEA